MQPNIHFFEFNDASNPNNNLERFGVLWHLDVNSANQPPSKPDQPAGDWKGIFEGDLVVFPSLLSGAGEFEAVRFVGPKTTHFSPEGTDDEVLPLLTAGIEYPEFPTLIVTMAEERGISLRELYEKPFDAILQSQLPKMTLLEIMGFDAAGYKEFWDDVPVARRRRPPSSDPWKFSLGSECFWIRTLDGESLAGEAEKKGEEL